jgi:hypothetical protein
LRGVDGFESRCADGEATSRPIEIGYRRSSFVRYFSASLSSYAAGEPNVSSEERIVAALRVRQRGFD